MSNHLNLTKFNVRSEGRTSETLYGGPGLCFGTGQGGGGSPPNWIFLHDVTLKTLEAHPIKSCVIHDPRTGEKKSSNSNAFADDMNFASMDTTQKLSVEQVCSNLQIMGQTANDCIRASGGSFNLAKCSWRCSKPTVIYGKPEVEEIIRDLEIVPTQDSSAVHIPRLSKETPHRQLGVQLVPSLSPSPQLDLLRLKCLKFGSIMRRNTLTNHQSNVVFEHYIAPAIQYPCTTQAIQSKDIDSLQSITLRPLLSKLGISSTFARKALYAPSKYGGANLKCWHLEVLAKQLALLISNLDGDGWLGFILRASTNFTQLEWGKSGHFLESSDTMVASVCTPTWITVIQSNCQKKDIRLPGGWVPHSNGIGIYTSATYLPNTTSISAPLRPGNTTKSSNICTLQPCQIWWTPLGKYFGSQPGTAKNSANRSINGQRIPSKSPPNTSISGIQFWNKSSALELVN